MRNLFVTLLMLVVSGVAMAQFSPRTPPGSTTRTLNGVVMDAAGNPVSDALVVLKDTKSGAVKTFITGADGSYRFHQLSFNVDYEVRADAGNKHSDTRTLSSFDTRLDAQINLHILH